MPNFFHSRGKRFLKAVAGVGLLLVCAPALRASSLTDYMVRVSSAVSLVQEAESAYNSGSRNPQTIVDRNLPLVRQQLPPSETVQLQGQAIAINNSWLYQALSEVEKSTDRTYRRALLARTVERLGALHERLQELRTAATSATDKDADKGRLAEILRRPEYLQTPPESSVLERLLDRFLRWLGKLIPRTKPIQSGGSPLVSTVTQILVVGICLAALAFLIWRFGPRLMQERRKKKPKREARIVLGEHLEPDQTAADLMAQADALARNGDLRAAIRKAYIALLCELGDRKLISLAQSKTNRDYLYSVRDKGPLYNSMRKLTTSFEVHWYGLVPAGENDWHDFRNNYQQTLRTGSG